MSLFQPASNFSELNTLQKILYRVSLLILLGLSIWVVFWEDFGFEFVFIYMNLMFVPSAWLTSRLRGNPLTVSLSMTALAFLVAVGGGFLLHTVPRQDPIHLVLLVLTFINIYCWEKLYRQPVVGEEE